MLRLEKIKEYKNLKSFYRIIYSEAHGMILTVNYSGTGMKVHSFASGKLLLQHRFPDEGKFSRMLRVGRWVFIWLYSTLDSKLGLGKGALLVCDLETLSVRELILCEFARGTLGRIGNRLFFPVLLHPVLESREGGDRTEAVSPRLFCSFDLTDGTFTPCPELANIAQSIGWFGPTRCFGYTEQRLICYAVDEHGLPTLQSTGEVNERWGLQLCASKCYLFESRDEHGGAEIVSCDHEMRLISRKPVSQVPDGWNYQGNMVVAEVRDAANPGILVMVPFSRKNEGWGNNYFHVSFYDPEFRNLVWQHGGPGYPYAYLLDGYLVRRVAKEVELIDIRTGAHNRISFGGWDPEFHSATGYTLEQTDMADKNSVGYDDPPRHIFWRETCYSPLSLGVVVDSETAGPAPLPVVAPPVRERKKPDYGIPEIPEQPAVHILCADNSAELSFRLNAFGEWLSFFRKAGVNLYGYIYDCGGEGLCTDEELEEMGHTPEEIECFRLASTDDWHDPRVLAADLRRCSALVPDKPSNSLSRRRILAELAALIDYCDKAAAVELKVQLLSPPSDCDDGDDGFDEGEDDDEDE